MHLWDGYAAKQRVKNAQLSTLTYIGGDSSDIHQSNGTITAECLEKYVSVLLSIFFWISRHLCRQVLHWYTGGILSFVTCNGKANILCTMFFCTENVTTLILTKAMLWVKEEQHCDCTPANIHFFMLNVFLWLLFNVLRLHAEVRINYSIVRLLNSNAFHYWCWHFSQYYNKTKMGPSCLQSNRCIWLKIVLSDELCLVMGM